MTPQWFYNALGLDFKEVESVTGCPTLEVTTSFSFSDGTPIGFYVSSSGDEIALSDNGDALYHFHTLGLDNDWPTLREDMTRQLNPYNTQLSRFGEIRLRGRKHNASALLADYMAALVCVADLERQVADEQLLTHYIRNRLAPGLQVRGNAKGLLVETPFAHPSGDPIHVLVSRRREGGYLIHDDGACASQISRTLLNSDAEFETRHIEPLMRANTTRWNAGHARIETEAENRETVLDSVNRMAQAIVQVHAVALVSAHEHETAG